MTSSVLCTIGDQATTLLYTSLEYEWEYKKKISVNTLNILYKRKNKNHRAITNEQSRDTCNIGQSRMNNPENKNHTAIKNE